MATLTLAIGALAVPGSALAGGCEVLTDVGDRARCEARAEARAAARAEVDRAVEDGAARDASSAGAGAPRSAAWEDAIAESRGVDLDELLEPRPIAAIGGLAWFALVVRARRRARARAHG